MTTPGTLGKLSGARAISLVSPDWFAYPEMQMKEVVSERPSAETQAAVPAVDASRNSLVPVAERIVLRHGRRMSRWVWLVVAAGLAAVGLLWITVGGGLTPPTVSTQTLVAGPVSRVLAVSGRTAAETEAKITAALSERVRTVAVSEGDLVGVGDLLVELDTSRQHLVIRQALAALDAAIVARKEARDSADRTRALGSTVSDVSRQTAERALERANNEVERLTAAFEQAKRGLADYRIIAPIPGTILKRSVEPGDLVDPTRVLMRLADQTRIRVEVEIDETYSNQMRIGQSADLQLAGREEVYSGRVSFIGTEVDPLTGSLRVLINFDTPPLVQIGLTAVANIRVDRVEEALTVPRTALLAGAAGPAVFVVRDGRAVRAPIAFIDWPADRVQVTRGLGAGDVNLLSPDGIEDGDAVTPQDHGPGG